MSRLLRHACAVISFIPAIAMAGPISSSISFNDPLSEGAPFYSQISSHVDAALNLWGSYLAGSASFEVQVDITSSTPRAAGGSFTSAFLRNNGQKNIFEQGAGYELRTGIDPNGADPDIHILFNPDYLSNELWFDPDPRTRKAPVDPAKVDALSVLMHEVTHGLAFNGWGDPYTGQTPADYASTWDELTYFDGANLFFVGPKSVSLYGAPVPITRGNNFHIGNLPGPGADLIPDVMNGVVFYTGKRYAISNIDLAMMEDMGLHVTRWIPDRPPAGVPEPGTTVLWAIGAASLALVRRRRFQGPAASPNRRH